MAAAMLKIFESNLNFYCLWNSLFFMPKYQYLPKKLFQDSIYKVIQVFYFHSYNNFTNTH